MFAGVGEDWEKEDEEKSWAEEMEEVDSGKGKEDEGKKTQGKKSRGLDVQDVIVASCSDDGTVRLWRPLQVSGLSVLALIPSLPQACKSFKGWNVHSHACTLNIFWVL